MPLRHKHLWVLVGCAASLFVLIFFEPAYGWRVRGWLNPRSDVQMLQADSPSLMAQNETLQAQLAVLQSVAKQIPQNPQNQIRAMVYLQYPFGFRNELLVNAGSNENVAVGKAVTFQGIFIGTVAQVFSDSAIIQTVFDPTLKMPVRIGGGADGNTVAGSYDALLVGGADPLAASIAKGASIASGDIIYTAASDLPYGLPIGAVNATSASADNLFEQASISFAYDMSGMQSVLIQR